MPKVIVLRNIVHEHLRKVGEKLELDVETAERLVKEGLVEIEKVSTGRSRHSDKTE